ncbi:MAG: class B sortase [Clostridia bacterium]
MREIRKKSIEEKIEKIVAKNIDIVPVSSETVKRAPLKKEGKKNINLVAKLNEKLKKKTNKKESVKRKEKDTISELNTNDKTSKKKKVASAEKKKITFAKKKNATFAKETTVASTEENKVASSKKKKVSSKEKKKLDRISIVVLVVSILLIILAIVLLINWLLDDVKTNTIAKTIAKEPDVVQVASEEKAELVNPPVDKNNDYWNYIKMPLINVNFDELLEKNKQTVGWIQVNNTNINYPLVQTSNNEDYLHKAFDGTANQAGWVFADYRNNMKDFDNNTIIYGHSRLNKTMFGSLLNVLNPSWFNNKENHIIKLSTPTENTLWQVFSVYKTPVESYYLTTSFLYETNFLKFANTLKSRSVHPFNSELVGTDKLLTLSTCSDVAGTGRVVVHAKLIKRQPRV